jgi:hypothetical protein
MPWIQGKRTCFEGGEALAKSGIRAALFGGHIVTYCHGSSRVHTVQRVVGVTKVTTKPSALFTISRSQDSELVTPLRVLIQYYLGPRWDAISQRQKLRRICVLRCRSYRFAWGAWRPDWWEKTVVRIASWSGRNWQLLLRHHGRSHGRRQTRLRRTVGLDLPLGIKS